MNRIALEMLFGRPGKYLAMVFAISFGVLLITQQTAVFLGILWRSTGPLQNVGNIDIWVASQKTTYVDMVRGMNEQSLDRVRSIPGVAWAQPFLSIRAMAELPDGNFAAVDVIGVDRSTLVGQPPEVIEGQIASLRAPNTVMLETSQRFRLPGIGVGDRLRLNDREVRVAGICRARTGILSRPLLFTTYDNAVHYVPRGRKSLTWVLVKVKPGVPLSQICERIEGQLGLAAFTVDRLRWETMQYIMFQTSIGMNFLSTIALGFMVGLVVSTAAFNQFTSDSLPHYATLKAMGTPSSQLVRVVLLQSVTAGLISYGIGLGVAAVVSLPGRSPDAQLTAHYSWQLLIAALVPMLICVAAGSIVSLWRILRLDPVLVFQS